MPPELQEIRGRDAMHQRLLSNFVPFPDYQEELEWLVGERDFVAWRSRGTGTQSGPFGPFPATGKRLDLVIIGMHRFEGALVAETWTSWDKLAALTQLGHFASAQLALSVAPACRILDSARRASGCGIVKTRYRSRPAGAPAHAPSPMRCGRPSGTSGQFRWVLP
jgi:predicted ester cyclase